MCAHAIKSPYDLWAAGAHDELQHCTERGFLRWCSNKEEFPDEKWLPRFLELGRLKRLMWERVGKETLDWCPVVELRMPPGCTAACRYCNGAKVRRDPHANTKETLFAAISEMKFPETVALCAEWGDPCMHPDVVDAVNARIRNEWIATKYTFLTNLSLTDAPFAALPYTRSMVVHFTMSEPSHAVSIMGYRDEKMFAQVLDNVRAACAMVRDGKVSAKISIVYIVEPKTLPFVAEHYRHFRDLEGLAFVRYKPAYKYKHGRLADHPESARQRRLLNELTGSVPHEWTV